jgi:hypothetical protein
MIELFFSFVFTEQFYPALEDREKKSIGFLSQKQLLTAH